jgi:hypothetical protein
MKTLWAGLSFVCVMAIAIMGWVLSMVLVLIGFIGLCVVDKILEGTAMSGALWAFIGVVVLIANAVNRMPPELPPVHGEAREADDTELRDKGLM